MRAAFICLVAAALLSGIACDSGSNVEKAMGLEEGGKYDRDRREMDASRLLGQARNFEGANPYEEKEVIASKYREVFEKYPGTEAAKDAKEAYEEVMKRR